MKATNYLMTIAGLSLLIMSSTVSAKMYHCGNTFSDAPCSQAGIVAKIAESDKSAEHQVRKRGVALINSIESILAINNAILEEYEYFIENDIVIGNIIKNNMDNIEACIRKLTCILPRVSDYR